MTNNTLNIGQEIKGNNTIYRIVDVLGQGSFGITYKAKAYMVMKGEFGEELVETNSIKAIKEFFMKEINERREDGSLGGMSKGSLSYNYAEKFKKEAKSLAGMDCPNIVKVIDFISANNTYYYVMDYIEGENLNEYLKHHTMTEKEATDTIIEVANALRYMHEEKRMLHLDIKPGNIMRRAKDGHIFLIDFGLSKHYSEDGNPETSTNVGVGTPGYAPIEQANSKSEKKFKATLDVYALGATYFKLLTGQTPPSADELVSDDSLLLAALDKKKVSPVIVSAIKEAMEPNVNKRTQSVVSFLKNMRNYICENDTENTVLPLDIQEEKQKKGKCKNICIFFILAFLLCVGIIGIYFLLTKSNYDQNFSEELVEAANKGDELAQYWLGNCYFNGRGVSIDEKKAFDWYIKSANQGLDSAQVALGICYNSGIGVEQDFDEAIRWTNIAISKDNADAFNSLGAFYLWGDGVKVDTIKAIEYFKKAVERGSAAGMRHMGYVYLYGEGVKADTAEALQWFKKAEEKEEYSTIRFLNHYYQGEYGGKRDSLKCINMLLGRLENAKDTTTIRDTYCQIAQFYERVDGIHKNTKEAIKWYRKAAELGSAEGMYWTGMFYIWGDNIPQNYSKAFHWLYKCANLKRIPWEGKHIHEAIRQYKNSSYEKYCIIEAQRTIAHNYYNGDGVEKNMDQYLFWLKKAASNGSNEAQHSVGHIYKDGTDKVKKDEKEAYKWFEIAVENESGEACVDIAFAYFNGLAGYIKDKEKGLKYLELGVNRKNPLAAFNLGIVYYNGQYDVKIDKTKAKKYLIIAKDLGYKEAKEALGSLF